MQGFFQYLMSFDVRDLAVFATAIVSLVLTIAYFYSGVNFKPTAAFSTTGARRQGMAGTIALLIFLITASTLFINWFGAEKKKIEDAQKNETFHVIENAAKIPGNPFDAFAKLGQPGGVKVPTKDLDQDDSFLVDIKAQALAIAKKDGEKNTIQTVKALRFKTNAEYTKITDIVVIYDGTDKKAEEYEDLDVTVKPDLNEEESLAIVNDFIKPELDVSGGPIPTSTVNSSSSPSTASNASTSKISLPAPKNVSKKNAKKVASPAATPSTKPRGTGAADPMPSTSGNPIPSNTDPMPSTSTNPVPVDTMD